MATNLKISQLDSAVTPLTDTDLIPVVQSVNSDLITKQATIGELKSSVLAGATGLKYTGGETAIEATDSQIYVYQEGGDQMMLLDPVYSNVALNMANSDSSVSSAFLLNEKGLSFTRTQTSGGVTGVSQIRLNSADVYLLSNKNINLIAGATSADVSSFTSDKLRTDASINILVGKNITCTSNGKQSIINTDVDDPETLSTSGTVTYYRLHTYHDLLTVHNGLTFSASRQTTLYNKNLSTNVITQTGDSTEIYGTISLSRDGASITTSVMNICVSDSFNVKDSSGTTLFSNSTISSLSSNVSILRSVLSGTAATPVLTASTLTVSSTPTASELTTCVYVKAADGTLKSVSLSTLKTLLAAV